MNIDRRSFLAMSAAAGLSAATSTQASVNYDEVIAIDGLGGLGSRGTGWDKPLTAEDLAIVCGSGLSCVHMTLGQVGAMPPAEAYRSIVDDIAFWNNSAEQGAGLLSTVRTADDIRNAKTNGTLGMLYGLQDGIAFEQNLDNMRTLRQLGIRIIQPTYNLRNALGDGCMVEDDQGLSAKGKDAIAKMNELNIMVDLSHCSRKTASAAIRASSAPVSFTHTGCYTLREHPRHRTDSEIRSISNSGGITGIFIMPYLAGGAQPTADDVLSHIDYALNVGGSDHVSIGTDGSVAPVELTDEYKEAFAANVRRRAELGIGAPGENETGYLFASDLNTARRFETIADMMSDRGHKDSVIEKVLGANFLRVFEEVCG